MLGTVFVEARQTCEIIHPTPYSPQTKPKPRALNIVGHGGLSGKNDGRMVKDGTRDVINMWSDGRGAGVVSYFPNKRILSHHSQEVEAFKESGLRATRPLRWSSPGCPCFIPNWLASNAASTFRCVAGVRCRVWGFMWRLARLGGESIGFGTSFGFLRLDREHLVKVCKSSWEDQNLKLHLFFLLVFGSIAIRPVVRVHLSRGAQLQVKRPWDLKRF